MTLKSELPAIPPALVDAALVDGRTAAACGAISLSQWYDLVRRKEAPQPVVREPRCTRWTLTSVRDFWIARVEKAAADHRGAKLVIDAATRASAAAKSKRRAAAPAASQ